MADLAVQPASDALLIATWLRDYPANTKRAYTAEIARFVAFVGKRLAEVTRTDAQDFFESRSHLAVSTQARTIACVRSLLRFAHDTGYLPFNVALRLRSPRGRDRLSERILTTEQVWRMIGAEPSKRNHALLLAFYGSGCRVSELAALKWRDCQPRDNAGQITVLGKGDKTRAVLLPRAAWRELLALGPGLPDDPVFVSRQGGHLSGYQIWRIVRQAARRVGVDLGVSPHWMRHAHASHALDRGAPLSLVSETLGHANAATTGKYLHARPGESSGRFLGMN